VAHFVHASEVLPATHPALKAHPELFEAEAPGEEATPATKRTTKMNRAGTVLLSTARRCACRTTPISGGSPTRPVRTRWRAAPQQRSGPRHCAAGPRPPLLPLV